MNAMKKSYADGHSSSVFLPNKKYIGYWRRNGVVGVGIAVLQSQFSNQIKNTQSKRNRSSIDIGNQELEDLVREGEPTIGYQRTGTFHMFLF